MTRPLNASELLDVEVDEFARLLAFITARRRRRIEQSMGNRRSARTTAT
jgi:hypothetical protein